MKLNNSTDFLEDFFQSQIRNWEFAAANYQKLSNVKTKKFTVNNNSIIVQHNPERATSTFAETDETAIKKRKCFLCAKNLFNEQELLPLTENFSALVNPFPILSRHYTVKFNEHAPQKISENFDEFLEITDLLSDKYFVLYNGPDCGASVPEHRHFQVGTANEIPILNNLKSNDKPLQIINDGLRAYFLLAAESASEITEHFFRIFEKLEKEFPSERETKINLLGVKRNGKFELLVFPRKKHRPDIFFREKNPVKISPATLDISGILTAPLSNDFETINEEIIREIFGDVLYSENEIKKCI